MKKVFMLLAVAGMFSLYACNAPAEKTEETVAEEPVTEQVEETVQDTAAVVQDTTAVETPAAE